MQAYQSQRDHFYYRGYVVNAFRLILPVQVQLKQGILHLYKTNPNIHIDVSISSPKISLKNAKATITGIYPNIFQITENSSGIQKSHTIQYVDIITKNVNILELPKK